jgi:hypothetical protein
MSRTVALWVSVALLLGVALGAIPTFLTFHGSKSSPKSSRAIPVYLASPVPYPRPRWECLRNQLLNNSLTVRSWCLREQLLRLDQPHAVLVTN